MDPDTPKDYFISYTHADQRWAEWIVWHLEEAGYSTLLQAWDFLAGSNFVHEMDTAAKQATRTIAVLYPDYFTSQFTFPEITPAVKHRAAPDPRHDEEPSSHAAIVEYACIHRQMFSQVRSRAITVRVR